MNDEQTDAEVGRDMAKLSDAERLARAVLLFHKVEWHDWDRQVWFALTGSHDATTRILCDLAREIRSREESAR
jgi:hypothetical protein